MSSPTLAVFGKDSEWKERKARRSFHPDVQGELFKWAEAQTKSKTNGWMVVRYEALSVLHSLHEGPESNAKAAWALKFFSMILASGQRILSPHL